MDHFARLGLPAALDLEPASIDRVYFALQRQWHPDRFVNRPPDERARASAEAAALNDAYRTLKDPIARTEYLLAMEGIQLEEQSRAATDAARAAGTEKKQVAPPDLLEGSLVDFPHEVDQASVRLHAERWSEGQAGRQVTRGRGQPVDCHFRGTVGTRSRFEHRTLVHMWRLTCVEDRKSRSGRGGDLGPGGLGCAVGELGRGDVQGMAEGPVDDALGAEDPDHRPDHPR